MADKKILKPILSGMIPTLPYSKIAGKLVKEFGLAPMAQSKSTPAAGGTARLAKKTTVPGGRTPGIPAAHIHYKGEIYLLNSKQWKAFSTGLMAEFQARLGKAKTVSFDQLQKISEAVDSLSK